jgi:hypothetical protein
MTPQPEPARPEDALPEDALPEDALPEDAVPEDALPARDPVPHPKTPFPKRLPTEAEWDAAFDASRSRDYSRGGPPYTPDAEASAASGGSDYTPAAEASAASGGSGDEGVEAEDMEEEAVDPGTWHRPLPDACCCGRPWVRQWAHSPRACAEWGLGMAIPGAGHDGPFLGLPADADTGPAEVVGSPGDESGDEDDIMAGLLDIQRAIQEELHAEINTLQEDGWVLSRAELEEHQDFTATREEEILGRRWLTLAHTDRLPEALRWNLRKVQAEGDGRLTMSDIRRELLEMTMMKMALEQFVEQPVPVL